MQRKDDQPKPLLRPITKLNELLTFSKDELLAWERYVNEKYGSTLLINALEDDNFALFDKLVNEGICDVHYNSSESGTPLECLVRDYNPGHSEKKAQQIIFQLLADPKTRDEELRSAFVRAMHLFPIAEEKGELTLHTFLKTERIDASSMESGLINSFAFCFNIAGNYLTDKLKRALELYDYLKQFKPVNEFHTRALDEAKAGPILKGFLQTERFLRERPAEADDRETFKIYRLFCCKGCRSRSKISDELLAAGQLNTLIREFITMPTDEQFRGRYHGYEELAAQLEVLQKKYPVLKQGKLHEICSELGENIASHSSLKPRK